MTKVRQRGPLPGRRRVDRLTRGSDRGSNEAVSGSAGTHPEDGLRSRWRDPNFVGCVDPPSHRRTDRRFGDRRERVIPLRSIILRWFWPPASMPPKRKRHERNRRPTTRMPRTASSVGRIVRCKRSFGPSGVLAPTPFAVPDRHLIVRRVGCGRRYRLRPSSPVSVLPHERAASSKRNIEAWHEGKEGTEMPKMIRKSLDTPEESRPFTDGKGKVDLVNLDSGAVGRATFEPGWRWSSHVKPIAKTESCQAPPPRLLRVRSNGRSYG